MPSEKSTMKRFRYTAPYETGSASGREHLYSVGSIASDRRNHRASHGSGGTGSSNRLASTGNFPRGGTRSRARWAMECSKLLEAMWELDESEPFRRPIDPCKYPDFYSRTSNPLDLQKIRIKFQQGMYATPDEFSKDVHKMFDYYKKFFSDPESQIYGQAHRLSWWFKSEMGRIQFVASKSKKNSKASQQQQQQHQSSNSSNVNSNNRCSSSSERTVPSLMSLDTQAASLQPASATATSPDTNIILSIKHGQCTILHPGGTTPPSPDDSHSTVTLTSTASDQSTRPSTTVTTAMSSMESYTSSSLNSTFAGSTSGVAHTTVTRAVVSSLVHPSSPGVNLKTTPKRPSEQAIKTSSGRLRRASQTGEVSNLRAYLDISTVWCGTCKFRPNRAVLLDAEGLTMYLKKNEADVAFRIKADDIVRCMGHIEKTRKHTLFLSLLPSCSRRFSSMFGDKTGTCSLLAMFFPAVGVTTISKIIHIFWLMSKKSMFGPLFCEVNSKAALELLSHIRPAILNRLGGSSPGDDSMNQGLPNGDLSSHRRSQTQSSGVETSVTDGIVTNSNSSSTSQSTHQRALTMPSLTLPLAVSSSSGAISTQNHTPTSSSSLPTSTHPSLSRTESSAPSSRQQTDEIQNLSNWLYAPSNVPIPPLRASLDSPCLPSLFNRSNAGTPDDFTVNSEDFSPGNASLHCDSTPMDTGRQVVAVQETSTAVQPDSEISIVQIDEDDSDLEIVIPSEEDDMMITALEEEADGEDLMVMAGKISIKCPVTQLVMKHPVKNKHCGHCYDREGIEQLIKDRAEKARCPVPGCSNVEPLKVKDMVPDFELWTQIQSKLKLLPS